MLLKDKVAVIYGAGGVGSAVAHAFAREGARLFLTGRQKAKVEAVADELAVTGVIADAAEVNALDEQAVDRHLDAVIEKAGRLDIVFDSVGIPNTKIQGTPFAELDVEDFARPIVTYTNAYLFIARQAAKRMIPQRSGVIMVATSVPSRAGIPLLGGFTPSQAAVEAMTRSMSAEFAPHGLRVVGVRPDGMPDSPTIKEVFGIHARALGISWNQFRELIASKNHRRKLPSLAEMANVAAFMASDRASAMTGTTVNLTMGMLDD